MIKIKVEPGNCHLSSHLTCTADEQNKVTIGGNSECQHVQKLLSALAEQQDLRGCQEVFQKNHPSTVLQRAKEILPHMTCPVPLAILKGIEASCGLSLAQDVTIHMENTDD